MIKKKILVFSNSFPFGHGEQFLQEEIGYLSGEFDVTILPLFSNSTDQLRNTPPGVIVLKPLFPHLLKNKIRLVFTGLPGFPLRRAFSELFALNRSNLARSVKSLGTASLISSMAWKKMKAHLLLEGFNEFDLIYFYWGDNATYLVPELRRIFNGRIAVKFHGSDLYESVKGGYIPFRRSLLEQIDLALFVSDHGRNYLTRKYVDIPFRAETFRLGVRDYGTGPVKHGNVLNIVSCANTVPLKRIPLIIKALALLAFPVKWVHFGDGSDFEKVRALAETLPSNIQADLKGNVNHERLTDYYRNNPIDLFINSSESEGLPVSIMEALSFGIPVIATDAGGTGEIVNDSDGFLLPVRIEPSDLAASINEFFLRDNKDQLRHNARQIFLDLCDAEINYKRLTAFLSGFLNNESNQN
jgi:colanic acid/amylovoran biosynthesis glycosyltransferase